MNAIDFKARWSKIYSGQQFTFKEKQRNLEAKSEALRDPSEAFRRNSTGSIGHCRY